MEGATEASLTPLSFSRVVIESSVSARMPMSAAVLAFGKVKSGTTFPTGLFRKSFRCFCFVGISKGQLKLQRRIWMQFSP